MGRKMNPILKPLSKLVKDKHGELLESYINNLLNRRYSNFYTSMMQGTLKLWEVLLISYDLDVKPHEWLPKYSFYREIVEAQIDRKIENKSNFKDIRSTNQANAKRERLNYVSGQTSAGSGKGNFNDLILKRKRRV